MRWHLAHLETLPAETTEESQSAGVHRAELSEIEVSQARIVPDDLFKLLNLLARQTTLQANAADVPFLYDAEANGHSRPP